MATNIPLDLRPRFQKGPLYRMDATGELITPARKVTNEIQFSGNSTGNVEEQAGTVTEVPHPNA